MTRCQRAMDTWNSRKWSSGSCSSFNLKISLSNTCLLFPDITQHREYDWCILIELNNRIITVIEAMVTFKPHKNKENEIEHYGYQSVNQTLGTWSQLFFFPTPANGLELLVNEMFFLL